MGHTLHMGSMDSIWSVRLCVYVFIHMFKSLFCPYTAVQTMTGRCRLIWKLITGISAKKHTPGHIQPSNAGPLFQLLHIAAPIRVEQVQNQNCELPDLGREKAEAPGGSNEVLTPTLLYYVIML